MKRFMFAAVVLLYILAFSMPAFGSSSNKESEEVMRVASSFAGKTLETLKAKTFKLDELVCHDENGLETVAAKFDTKTLKRRVTSGKEFDIVKTIVEKINDLQSRTLKTRLDFLLLDDDSMEPRTVNGFVLVLSKKLVRQLTSTKKVNKEKLIVDDELFGVVAHEAAHGFLGDAMAKAIASKDQGALRAVELECDKIAFVTMKLAGRDTAAFARGVQRLDNAMPKGPGGAPASLAHTHPLVSERKALFELLAKQLEQPSVLAQK